MVSRLWEKHAVRAVATGWPSGALVLKGVTPLHRGQFLAPLEFSLRDRPQQRPLSVPSNQIRDPLPFIARRVLVISKVTLLAALVHHHHPTTSARKRWDQLGSSEREKLAKTLTRQGFNMSELIESHEKQTASVNRILDALTDHKIDFTLVSPAVRVSDQWEVCTNSAHPACLSVCFAGNPLEYSRALWASLRPCPWQMRAPSHPSCRPRPLECSRTL